MSLWCDDFYVTPQDYYVIKVITRLLHQGISRLLRHGGVDQSQAVSKSADFRCEEMHFCSSESHESRIFGISALRTIVLKNKTKLFFDLQLVAGRQQNGDYFNMLTRALMGSGELHVLMGGVAQRVPLRIFKSKSRRVKIQTALERSRRTTGYDYVDLIF